LIALVYDILTPKLVFMISQWGSNDEP
jgi:hypothetical protein